MKKNNTMVSVMSNCNFSLNYKTSKLEPQTEIIIITTSPKYVIDNKKDNLVKVADVSEYRFITTLAGVNALIGELQIVVKNMNQFEQLSSSFNALIENSKDEKNVD